MRESRIPPNAALPKMNPFLLQSADSITTKKDSHREISAKGQSSLKKLAAFLDKKELKRVTEIRHSPFVRAKQTAENSKK
ncbi:MAG: hypothetical protein CMI18_14595 [Opitutaceae bacterium]|nr:hypothetical protein [Opitutaceae bacterium]